MARIVGHLSVEELGARYRAARAVTEARHAQAIWLLAQGRTVLEVAAGIEAQDFEQAANPGHRLFILIPGRGADDQPVLAMRSFVTKLAARYNALGPDALGDGRRHNGKAASLLSKGVLAALAERVRTPPEDGGLWSGPKAAAWIAAHLGLAKVHAQRGWEALKRIGWSVQAPRPRHPRAATPEQREALKSGWTRRSRGPRRRIPTARSRSGPRTSTASA